MAEGRDFERDHAEAAIMKVLEALYGTCERSGVSSYIERDIGRLQRADYVTWPERGRIAVQRICVAVIKGLVSMLCPKGSEVLLDDLTAEMGTPSRRAESASNLRMMQTIDAYWWSWSHGREDCSFCREVVG